MFWLGTWAPVPGSATTYFNRSKVNLADPWEDILYTGLALDAQSGDVIGVGYDTGGYGILAAESGEPGFGSGGYIGHQHINPTIHSDDWSGDIDFPSGPWTFDYGQVAIYVWGDDVGMEVAPISGEILVAKTSGEVAKISGEVATLRTLINVGDDPISRPRETDWDMTYVSLGNPVTISGVIRAVHIVCENGADDVRVGTFEQNTTSASYFTCRSHEYLGTLGDGDNIVALLSGGLAAHPGDFMGAYHRSFPGDGIVTSRSSDVGSGDDTYAVGIDAWSGEVKYIYHHATFAMSVYGWGDSPMVRPAPISGEILIAKTSGEPVQTSGQVAKISGETVLFRERGEEVTFGEPAIVLDTSAGDNYTWINRHQAPKAGKYTEIELVVSSGAVPGMSGCKVGVFYGTYPSDLTLRSGQVEVLPLPLTQGWYHIAGLSLNALSGDHLGFYEENGGGSLDSSSDGGSGVCYLILDQFGNPNVNYDEMSGGVSRVALQAIMYDPPETPQKVSGETIAINSGSPINYADKQHSYVHTMKTIGVSALSGGVALAATTPVRSAIIKCLSGYSDIYIGGSGTPVSLSNRPLSCHGLMLMEGEAVAMEIDNLDAIYATCHVSGSPLCVVGLCY
jgi:hypothetical protein